MKDDLHRFVGDHPEYFERQSEYVQIRGDLQPLVEQYSRAVDPAGYEKLRTLAGSAWKREEERIRERVKQMLEAKREEEEALDALLEEIKRTERELRVIEEETNAPPPVYPEIKQTSGKGSLFAVVALDLCGVLFLYVGIITQRQVSAGPIMVGLACILAGFYLQGRRRTNGIPERPSLEADELRKKNQFARLLRVKRISLKERERLHRERVVVIGRQIQAALTRLKEGK